MIAVLYVALIDIMRDFITLAISIWLILNFCLAHVCSESCSGGLITALNKTSLLEALDSHLLSRSACFVMSQRNRNVVAKYNSTSLEQINCTYKANNAPGRGRILLVECSAFEETGCPIGFAGKQCSVGKF